MTQKILFVDDEARVLDGIRRSVARDFDVMTAEGGAAALEVLKSQGPFAVIVSDMRMPNMNGVELLSTVKKLSPDTIRMMLTGNNDQETAVQAVNTGEVFRFMNKPCDGDTLKAALKAALRQHELVVAERQLLEQTLRGSIKAVTDILALVRPETFGSNARLRKRCKEIAEHLNVAKVWQVDTAAMLCHLGCVSISESLIQKIATNASVSNEESRQFESHPLLGAEIIAKIPRLSEVANCILYQHKNYDGSGFPRDNKKGDDIPMGARILRAVVAFDRHLSADWSESAAMEALRKQQGVFDPAVLDALEATREGESEARTRRVNFSQLVDSMVIEEDVKTSKGVLLVCEGQPVTPVIRQHLQKFAESGALSSSILVSDRSAKPANEAA